MNRIFLFLLFVIVATAFSQRTATRPYTFASGDTIRASYFESNYDTIYHVVNDNGDTMNTKFLRKADFRGFMTDSTWPASSFDSIKINGGNDYLSTYNDTAFACSLYDSATYRATVNARAIVVGKQITVHIPNITGNITTGKCYLRIPTKYCVTGTVANQILAVNIINNGSSTTGQAIITFESTYGIWILKEDGAVLDAGTGGAGGITLTYILN